MSPELNIDRPIALIVDDDRMVRTSMVRFLALCSMAAVQAASGSRALEILATQKVDLIICDQAMPDMAGLDVLRAARRDFPDVRRVLFSGNNHAELLLEAEKEGGVDMVITKGLDADLLRERLLSLRAQMTRGSSVIQGS